MNEAIEILTRYQAEVCEINPKTGARTFVYCGVEPNKERGIRTALLHGQRTNTWTQAGMSVQSFAYWLN